MQYNFLRYNVKKIYLLFFFGPWKHEKLPSKAAYFSKIDFFAVHTGQTAQKIKILYHQKPPNAELGI